MNIDELYSEMLKRWNNAKFSELKDRVKHG